MEDVADLLDQVPHHESIRSLTDDGAYDTQTAYEAAIQRGAIPIIPPRKNARVRKGNAFAHRNAAMHAGALAAEVAITNAAWLKPRCTASND